MLLTMNDIDFTFGIITNADSGVNEYLKKTITSIVELNVPNYEIIIIGNEGILKAESIISSNDKIKIINFDENIKPMWITRKKNLITQHAKYENIVYTHDYVEFDNSWYTGFKLFGDNFKACMTVILNNDGTRFRDWVIFPWHHCFGNNFKKDSKQLWEYANICNNESMLPYDELRFSKWQYFSGTYWVAKKHVMLEIPLDENLVWGNGEDCIWSNQFTNKYEFSMNSNSTVKFLKQKQDAFGMINKNCLEKCIQFINK